MSDQPVPEGNHETDAASPFDQLISATGASTEVTFSTAFRGYDKDEVDATIAALTDRMREATQQVAQLKQYQRKASTAVKQSREKVERLEAELAAANTDVETRVAAASADERDAVERLEAELAVAQAKLSNTEQQVQTLTEELMGASEDTPNRPQFEEVLRVAEDQAGVLLRNATLHGERILEASREEGEKRVKDAQNEADTIVLQAQHDAQQVQLRVETELTAHQARIDREAAHAAEKVAQAEREAAAIRSEAEKGVAALRSLVARETAASRAEAEKAVRELRMRALEFEESLTRRQDDAQQEFLVLHNQAVAHAERITQDANEQVAASLDHAKRVAAKADDFERLMRAQAQQIEADANMRARERLEEAHVKAQHIMDLVTTHSQTALRDAEDRARQLRWQQHELTSFMAEVKELIRPPAPIDFSQPATAGAASVDEALERDDDLELDDIDAEFAELTAQSEYDEESTDAAAGDAADADDADDAEDAGADDEAADADADAEVVAEEAVGQDEVRG